MRPHDAYGPVPRPRHADNEFIAPQQPTRAPQVFRNVAISGDAWFSRPDTRSISADGAMLVPAIRTRYRRCSIGPTPASSGWSRSANPVVSYVRSGRSARVPASSERCSGIVRHM
jgi:hypothetical protein